MAVADEVRRMLATRRDLSVAGLARSMRMRRATLSVRISGDVPFSPSLLDSVARAMGTTASAVVARAERTAAEPSGGRLGTRTTTTTPLRLTGHRRSRRTTERTSTDADQRHHDPAGSDRSGHGL